MDDIEIQRFKELLDDRDPEVRREAIYSLMGIEDTSVSIPLFIKAFEDGDWRVRKSAIEGMLMIRGEDVVRSLIDALYSENANQRNSAIEALIALGTEATDYLIKAFETDNHDVRKFVIDIFGVTADIRAMPVFLKAIHDVDENIQAAAVEHLGNLKSPLVVDTLLSVLEGDNIWLSFHAIEALGKIGDERVVDKLVSLLPERPLRKSLIKALGQIGRPDSLPSIIPYIKDESRSVREQTVLSIMKYYQRSTNEGLIIKSIMDILGDDAKAILSPYAQSEKRELSKSAILLLALLKDNHAIAHLLEMSADIEEEDRETFTKALEFIGITSPDLLLPYFDSDNAYQKRVLCEIAARTGRPIFFEPLVRLLKDEDGHVRGGAAVALSKLKDVGAVTHIIPLLLDEYENVQQEAIFALSELRDGLNIDDVIRWLSDENPVLRKNSALLIKRLKDKKSLEHLAIVIKDSVEDVRISAVEAIGEINGEESIRYLLIALTDESVEVRRASALALGRIPSERVVEPLILLLSDHDIWVKESAIRSLALRKDKRAVLPLIDLLNDDSGIIRLAAIESLGEFRGDEVRDALIRLLDDPDPEVRSAVVEALSGHDDILDDIRPLLNDKDWSVRKRVVDVIGRRFRDKNMELLNEIALTDSDPEVRETAKRYL
ncbi:MAG: HEAT repeat domain-containing protein [Thermodesulfovibrionia bacterium]